jgi:hypothetical protein
MATIARPITLEVPPTDIETRGPKNVDVLGMSLDIVPLAVAPVTKLVAIQETLCDVPFGEYNANS